MAAMPGISAGPGLTTTNIAGTTAAMPGGAAGATTAPVGGTVMRAPAPSAVSGIDQLFGTFSGLGLVGGLGGSSSVVTSASGGGALIGGFGGGGGMKLGGFANSPVLSTSTLPGTLGLGVATGPMTPISPTGAGTPIPGAGMATALPGGTTSAGGAPTSGREPATPVGPMQPATVAGLVPSDAEQRRQQEATARARTEAARGADRLPQETTSTSAATTQPRPADAPQRAPAATNEPRPASTPSQPATEAGPAPSPAPAAAPTRAPAPTPAPAPAPRPAPTPAPAPAPAAPATTTYTIQGGDTLTALARKFNTTVARLVELNGIANPDLIVAGRTLKVPA